MHDGWQYLALMRHGHSYANAAIKKGTDSHYYSVSGSDQSVELDERGRQEAAYSADLLAELFPRTRPLSRVWTSSFRRVTQSAETVAAKLNYPVEMSIDARLAKRSYGQFWNLTYRGVEELFPNEHELYAQQGKLAYRPPGGENYFDLFARVDQFLDAELNSATGNVLVVTHLVVILALQRRFDGLTVDEVVNKYEDVAIANGTVLLYRRRNSDEPWTFYRQHEPEIGARADIGTAEPATENQGATPTALLNPDTRFGVSELRMRNDMHRPIGEIQAETRAAIDRNNPVPVANDVEEAAKRYIKIGWKRINRAAARGKEQAKVPIWRWYFAKHAFSNAVALKVKEHFESRGFVVVLWTTFFRDRPLVLIRWNADPPRQATAQEDDDD